ncbi:MAG: hypothetical protein HOI23_10720 [Deltaproteobacteria bacterium]|jgi:hypothetical protein|nr:hypothetical protein [Deltaproteobacteria bacterium]MBT6432719.1 hypothetical protein [Deltaproteobacteria bacterium]MBT6488746.1 hypothetical protein [Deltaproteobacteria bacterium]
MSEAGENPKLSQAVELFSIGEVTSAVRLLLEALISYPGDPAVLSHLRYLEKLSPDSLAQVESELGMSVEHVMSRARDPIEVTVGGHDYIYYGLPPHLREDAAVEEELEDDGFEVDIGEPTMETTRPVLSEVTQPMVPMPKLADSWDIDTAPFSALDIPVSTDSFIEPELPEDEPTADTDATDLSALIIDATDTEDFNNAGGDATTSEFKTQDLPPLDPTNPGMSPMVLAPDPPSDMLDGWGAAEPEEEDDLSNTGITLIEAVSETGEYVIGDEAGMRLRALETRLKQFLELDDLTDALEVVEQILELEPEHGLALEARATCGEKLVKMYESKVGGDLGATPVVLLPPDQLVWQDLDHRAGFILSQVDGASRYQDILLISGMDRLDTMRILAQLVQDGVIGTP